MPSLYSVNEGTLEFNFHDGQQRAWDSLSRFIVILAGTQGGKTSWLPWWLYREVGKCGSGDYLAVTATYDLFKLKFLPALREVFEHVTEWGRYWASDRIIELRNPATWRFQANRADDPMWGRIILRSAESSGGLESSSALGAILDEAGMASFQLETWEAVLRRLSLARGRVALGTTIYDLGWLKTQIYDKWEACKRQHPAIDVIQFDSIENPSFPREEYNDRQADMPQWRFDMMYRGLFTRPAGMIYDCFTRGRNTCPRFEIPKHWKRYLGLDFGGVNTAGLFFAEDPRDGRFYGYREYLAGGRTAKEHAVEFLRDEPGIPFTVGGSKSEGQWRNEFSAAGLPVREPDQSDVEVGITRVYGAIKRTDVVLFDDLVQTLAQVNSYARKVDSKGEPTEEIKNKDMYHFLDAGRYVLSWKFRETLTKWVNTRATPTDSHYSASLGIPREW